MNKTLVFSKKEIIQKLDNIKKKIRLIHSKSKQNLDIVFWKSDDIEEISREHAYVFNLAIQIGFIEELKKDVKKWKNEEQSE